MNCKFSQPREGEINMILVNGQMCLLCAGTFPSHEAATIHYKEHHLNIKYISNTCRCYFGQYRSWDLHRMTSHTESNASSVTLNRSAQSQSSTQTHTSVRIQNNRRSASNAFDGNSPIGVAGPATKRSINSNDAHVFTIHRFVYKIANSFDFNYIFRIRHEAIRMYELHRRRMKWMMVPSIVNPCARVPGDWVVMEWR